MKSMLVLLYSRYLLEKPRRLELKYGHGAAAEILLCMEGSAEELREHVKRVGILVLATLMGLQAFLAMSVVYLLLR